MKLEISTAPRSLDLQGVSNMKRICLLLFIICCSISIQTTRAQHCAGISESYLSELSVKHVENSLRIKCEYSKVGGRDMAAYQGYVLAYFDKHADKVVGRDASEVVNPEFVQILHTQVMKRNADGRYNLEFSLKDAELAKAMIKIEGLTDQDRYSNRDGWGVYFNQVKLVVFIPFLENKTYSVLEGLPEDRHECNYHDAKALLFQQLPYSITIDTDGKEKYRVYVRSSDGDKPKK